MITVDDIATELGRATPPDGSLEYAQWTAWIDRAYRLINARAEARGVNPASLSATVVDDVVREAVTRRASRPGDGSEQVSRSVTVDDTTVRTDRQYGDAVGSFILDEWWSLLGLGRTRGGWAGSIQCR